MIFKSELCDKVLRREKTQTRRLKRENEYFTHGSFGQPDCVLRRSETTLDVRKWVVGRTYAVQPGRGKKAVGRIRLLAIREEALRDITWRDVKAEGVNLSGLGSRGRNRDIGAGHRFARLWNSINTKSGTLWGDNPTVWVLTFQCI